MSRNVFNRITRAYKHCAKSAQIGTRKNSVFGQFSHRESAISFPKTEQIRLKKLPKKLSILYDIISDSNVFFWLQMIWKLFWNRLLHKLLFNTVVRNGIMTISIYLVTFRYVNALIAPHHSFFKTFLHTTKLRNDRKVKKLWEKAGARVLTRKQELSADIIWIFSILFFQKFLVSI